MDRDIDFIEDEGNPPGRWNERSIWEGEWTWRLRRGAAEVTVLLGHWKLIEGATLPDGTPAGELVSSMTNLMGDDLWLRHAGESGRVTHGRITATADGIGFAPDAEQPSAAASWGDGETADLRDDLAASEGFAALIADSRQATALYGKLENRTYSRRNSRFAIGFRTAAAFIAEARGLGEEYTAFYCGRPTGTEGEVAAAEAAAAGAILRAGWTPYGAGDAEEDRARVDGLMAYAALREIAPRPRWAPQAPQAPSGGDDRISLLMALASEGRLSEDEYEDGQDRAWALKEFEEAGR